MYKFAYTDASKWNTFILCIAYKIIILFQHGNSGFE